MNNSAEMMKRCENALRTGQTENLFPVLARRTSEIIAEEVRQNRREWVNMGLGRRFKFAMMDLAVAFKPFTDALNAAATAMASVKVYEPAGTLPTALSFKARTDLILNDPLILEQARSLKPLYKFPL